MSLLNSFKVAATTTESAEVVVTSIKHLGKMRWDKDKKAMVERNALAADLLIVFKVGDKTHTASAYSANVFPAGVPLVGSKGLAGMLTFKANKDTTQPPNVVGFEPDYDSMGANTVALFQTIIAKTASSFD